MANSNQVELVVTVEVDKANQSIKSVNANLSGIEQTAVRAARGASQGIDGMTASMIKGATAGNLFADAIKKAMKEGWEARSKQLETDALRKDVFSGKVKIEDPDGAGARPDPVVRHEHRPAD